MAQKKIQESNSNTSFSINDLEILTGIKAHTIRVWEKRYCLLNPERNDANIRQYNENDLKYLLNISILINNGFKISKIAQMSSSELCRNIGSISNYCGAYESQLHSMKMAMLNFDEELFEKCVSGCIQKDGFIDTYEKVIFPFLNQVSLLWQTNIINAAQENFINSLIRQNLKMTLNHTVASQPTNTIKVILFLPKCEAHDINILYLKILIKTLGIKTYDIGQVSPSDLQAAQQQIKADYFISIFTTKPNCGQMASYLEELSEISSEAQFLVSGCRLENEKNLESLHHNIHFFSTPKEIFESIETVMIGNEQAV